MSTLGSRIKKMRESIQMTQETLAKKTGTTKQTIYKYENNIITNIPLSRIEILAKTLNTNPIHLVGWDSIEIENERTGGRT